MPLITPVGRAEQVPRADTSFPERPDETVVLILYDGDSTIPIATNHLNRITLFLEGSPTGSGVAEIYIRADNGTTPALLTSITFTTDDTVAEEINCPTGQIIVTNNGLDSLIVRVQGLIHAGVK